eukprot:CAMPEP_0182449378 /NCGR_PEP_ID=MMETSP1172-20130603/33885_1 /TAXON_ID=708627 /ORGANISM="Timspurckia oligopyrenoides, Strain CCMP3278" /LENGTH=370 /DNA_ID=CAMNT_0024646639 /DNA_START=420 /DNA_END=1532 /DNA_ORIENTATION=+
MKVLVLGETGVGKSTIANSLAGSVRFGSGASFGTGLTTVNTSKAIGDIEIVDVPGYNDAKAESSAIASDAVSEILMENADVVVVFVIVILTPWQLKTSDAYAMKSFVNAIQCLNAKRIKFGVILNKVCNEFIEQWSERTELCKKFRNQLAHHGCVDFLVLEKVDGMATKMNVMLPDDESERAKTFVGGLPSIRTGAGAGKVDFDNTNEIKRADSEGERMNERLRAWTGKRSVDFTVAHKSGGSSWFCIFQGNKKWKVLESEETICCMENDHGVLKFSVSYCRGPQFHFRKSLRDCEVGEEFAIELISEGKVICNGTKLHGTLSIGSVVQRVAQKAVALSVAVAVCGALSSSKNPEVDSNCALFAGESLFL